MLAWKDTTSFSQGDREKIPTTWSASVGRFRLVVTKGHIYYKGRWVLHVQPGLVDTEEMALEPSASPEMAFLAAERRFKKLLADAWETLTGVQLIAIDK